MALARDNMGSIQACPFYGKVSAGEFSSPFEEGDAIEKTSVIASKNFALSSSSSSSGQRSVSNSNGFMFRAAAEYHQPDEANSLINFKDGYDSLVHANGSLLSFEHNERVPGRSTFLKTGSDYSAWEGNFTHGYHWNQMNQKCSTDPRLMEDFNCFETAGNFGPLTKENHGDWLYCEATVVTTDSIQEAGSPEAACLKRPYMGESFQALKKQCMSSTSSTSSAIRKPKPKSPPSKDPQSIAAKNRRERISERLKMLQELVPNGSKVDLVTMLEKAISYVKFLQLQVKVLATDEFWPVQGGKAPDISQVKEAIDAILSSQKDRNSSSK